MKVTFEGRRSGYSGDHVWARTRRARRHHTCDWCGGGIAPGTAYTEYVGSPANEVMGGAWTRIKWHQRRNGECLR